MLCVVSRNVQTLNGRAAFLIGARFIFCFGNVSLRSCVKSIYTSIRVVFHREMKFTIYCFKAEGA